MGKGGFCGFDRVFGMRPASFLELAEDEVRVRGARVLERRRGPNVLAADDHRMLLSEIRADLVDGGLVRRVEFLRPARLDRVLPRPLVPELHDPTPSGPTDASAENKVSPLRTNRSRFTQASGK